MNTHPSTVESILRDNGGAIILTLAIILYHLFKAYYATVERKLYAKYYKYTSADLTYIDISKEQSRSITGDYLRIRHIGGTYVIIKSSPLATSIIRNSDDFVDNSFSAETFKVSLTCLGLPTDDTKTFKKFLHLITTEHHPATSTNSDNSSVPSPPPDTNDHLYRSCFTSVKYCLKELVVLFEAKSNRKETINLKPFCYRHAVNVLGVCVLGKSVNELTGSACQFYNICDDLVDILKDERRSKIGQYVTQAWRGLRSENGNEKYQRVCQFFRTTVRECLEATYGGDENCLLKGLLRRCRHHSYADGRPDHREIEDSVSAFLIAFCLNVVEILSGSLTLTLYQLAKRTELQERLRDTDKVAFDLDGIPDSKWSINESASLTDDVIEETLRTQPADPIVRLVSKRSHVPEPRTDLRLTPGTTVLIPLHILPAATGFIVDQETQSFNLFVDRFVRICLKASVTSLLQQYVFDIRDRWTDQDEGVTSCRLQTLPDRVLVGLSRLEKRGKTVVFEKSLRTFHEMKNASVFSLRALFT